MLITADNWKERMREAMQLRGHRPKTRASYLRVIREFAKYAGPEPERWREEDVRLYILYLQNERKLAPSSINVAIYGLRFFFTYTMERKCKVLDLLRVKVPKTLPVGMSLSLLM